MKGEGAADTGLGLENDPPTQPFGHLAGDGKPHAGARIPIARLEPLEHVEHLIGEARIDADAVSDIIGPDIAPASAPQDTGQGGFAGALAAWLTAETPAPGAVYHRALAAFEKPLIEYALGRTGGNQLRAAQLLGINRNTLRKRIGELGLEPERFSPS